MCGALKGLVRDQAKGLSPNVVARLQGEWTAEYGAWMKRDWSASRYIYWWADGIHSGLRQEGDARQCLLWIIGLKPDGRLPFYDFPAEHWLHLRTTDPIESSFATVRHRTTRTKNHVSRRTFLGCAFQAR